LYVRAALGFRGDLRRSSGILGFLGDPRDPRRSSAFIDTRSSVNANPPEEPEELRGTPRNPEELEEPEEPYWTGFC